MTRPKLFSITALYFVLLGLTCPSVIESVTAQQTKAAIRPPAVPLVACDPYFSIWSPADALASADTVHWTGKPHRLTSIVRIDGKPFRLMGKEPAQIPAFQQVDCRVLPTRTIYIFAGEGIRLSLTFMTAALPQNIDVLSRPVVYVTFEAVSTDRKQHRLETYFDAASELAVNTPDQQVIWTAEAVDGMSTLKVGSRDQEILRKKGDDVRIDWGYLYVAATASQKHDAKQAAADVARAGFSE